MNLLPNFNQRDPEGKEIDSLLKVYYYTDQLRPVVEHEGALWYIAKVDPYGVGFTQEPTRIEKATSLVPWDVIPTVHTYGSSFVFKPSIAEVFSQLGEWDDSIVAFRVEDSRKSKWSGCRIVRWCRYECYDLARTTLYRRADSEGDVQ